MRLRPDLGETHLALAYYYFKAAFSSAGRGAPGGTITGNFDRAREELAIARRKLPNNSEALFVEARIDRRQNRWDSAVANLQKANELDPRNGQIAFWLGQTYFCMRRYFDTEQLLKKRAANGTIDDTWFQLLVAEIKLAQGNPAAAQSLIEQVPLDFSPDHQVWEFRFSAALYLRDYDAASRVIASIPADMVDDFFEGRPDVWLTERLRVRVVIRTRRWRCLQPRARNWTQDGATSRGRGLLRASRADLMPGLAGKTRRSAKHFRRWSSCRLPKTRLAVRGMSQTWRWFTRGRASTTARSSNSKKLRRSRSARRTAISASIRAGMICAVINASTRSSPQPRLLANSRHELHELPRNFRLPPAAYCSDWCEFVQFVSSKLGIQRKLVVSRAVS